MCSRVEPILRLPRPSHRRRPPVGPLQVEGDAPELMMEPLRQADPGVLFFRLCFLAENAHGTAQHSDALSCSLPFLLFSSDERMAAIAAAQADTDIAATREHAEVVKNHAHNHD